MKIAVASGKGGTGKTSVATSLVYLFKEDVLLLDCDVEEPNAHIFFEPIELKEEEVGIPYPVIDFEKCTYCGVCQKVCAYNAILVTKNNVVLFEELCKGCGGCTLLCPFKAIHEERRKIGVKFSGKKGKVKLVGGRLNIGEVNTTFLIREVKREADGWRNIIVDAPPGTSCPLFESVKGMDYVILVAEPTPFGFFDLKLTVQVMRKLGLPFGVVINKHGIDGVELEKYLDDEGIDILARIPFERKYAELYSNGIPLIEDDEYRKIMEGLLKKLKER